MESSSINPYHYNNPVSFKDPTGLAPEPHEKEDEILSSKEDELQYKDMTTVMAEIIDDLGRYELQREENFPHPSSLGWGWSPTIVANIPGTLIRGFVTIYIAMEGGDSCTYEGEKWGSLAICTYGFDGTLLNKPAAREGKNNSESGMYRLTDSQKQEIKNNISVQASAKLSNPEAAITQFWDAFFEAFEEVTLEVYDLLITASIQVNLLEIQEFRNFSLSKGEKYYYTPGWCTTASHGMYFLTFSPELLGDLSLNRNYRYYNNINGYLSEVTGTQIIVHEIGHVWAWQKLGFNTYKLLSAESKENWAIYFCNFNYRGNNNMIYEAYYWPRTTVYTDYFYFKQ